MTVQSTSWAVDRSRPIRHRGIYGLWQQDGRLVLARKSRGPYKGLLDLPGGTPEPGESESETLHRELREECGVEVLEQGERCELTVHVDRCTDGSAIDYTHTVIAHRVAVRGPVDLTIREEDVDEVVLAGVDALAEISPPVAAVLAHWPDLRP